MTGGLSPDTIFRSPGGEQVPELRLGHRLEDLRPTLHNGPGWRIGIWVQGCRLRCTDRCLNPHLLGAGGLAVRWEDAAEAILRAATRAPVAAEGITVLGGEPTEQAAALVPVLAKVRAEGLSTMVYTGHTLEGLRESCRGDNRIAELLDLTDLLVDGPFEKENYSETLAWRGSTNQRLLRLTDRYSESDLFEAFARQRKAYSIAVDARGRLSVSGLQERTGAGRMEDLLSTRSTSSGEKVR
jgi:anaerobic ribonucleoside-triphosphate reductase activating protein